MKTEESCSRIKEPSLHFRPVGVGWCTPLHLLLLSAENYGEDDFESFKGGEDQDPNLDEEEVGCLPDAHCHPFFALSPYLTMIDHN